MINDIFNNAIKALEVGVSETSKIIKQIENDPSLPPEQLQQLKDANNKNIEEYKKVRKLKNDNIK